MKTTSHPIKATGRFAQTAVAGSAAAAGVFALQHQAEAAIVYSGVQNVGVSVAGGGNDNDVINIYGSITPEFSISVSASPNFGGARLNAVNGLVSIAKFFSGGKKLLKKVASGNVISNALGGWATNTAFLRTQGTYYDLGTWNDGDVAFGAFRLIAGGGNFRYGWIRLTWTDTGDANPYPNTLTAIDWAYQSDLNTAIVAGDTGAPVPEPSRALLALAGAGAAFLRRRRKSR